MELTMDNPQYENQPQPETAITFINTLNLGYSAVFVPQSQSRNAGENRASLNWRVTISKGRASITTDYMQGIGHLPGYSYAWRKSVAQDREERAAAESGRWKLKRLSPPALHEVLHSLVMDADVLNYADFEEWADSFGYDADSRAAEKIYQDCITNALQLRQILDIDAAAEAFIDY